MSVSSPNPALSQRRNAVWLAALTACVACLLYLLWRYDPRGYGLPLCLFHATTGLHCPGCGATRATHELLHGYFLSSLRDNSFFVVSLPLVLYTAVSEARFLLVGRPLPADPIRRRWFLPLIGVLLLVFGVLRNLPFEPFVFLAPPG